jgi:DNA polymerase-3 subunit delta
MDALSFLATANPKRQPVYAVGGDEDFLKRLVRERIISATLGDAEPDFAVTIVPGDRLDFSTVRNELDTRPFLAPCRVLIVENADTFVTDNRAALEQYVGKPSSVGVLVLEVKSFPETTKLAKALPDTSKVLCKAPPPYKLPPWCVEWAKTRYNKKLALPAAELLVELVGGGMGLLDQELGKLTGAVGAKSAITADDVAKLVGRSKAAEVFRIMDAIGDGNATEALNILEDLFAEGEDPMAVLGPMTAQLRKLAAVGRLTAEGMPLGPAMNAAKVPTWEKARTSFEKQLKHLGRRRLGRLTEWLTEINLGLKGGNPLPERVQVERLIVMLARPREDAKRA